MPEAAVQARSGSSMVVAVLFAAFIVVGWLSFAYFAFGTPGGLVGAWASVRALPLVVQLLMWLALLPWMIALWIFQLSWPLWLRFVLILGMVWVTYSMAIPPLLQMIRGR